MVKCIYIDIFYVLKILLVMFLKIIGVLLMFLRDVFSFYCREKKSIRKFLIIKEKLFREINC